MRVRNADDVDGIVAEVAELLRSRGERMTGPRRAVVAVVAAHDGHPSADTLVSLVAERDPKVHRASVYRTLEALSDLGMVQHVHLGHGATTYHLVGGAGRHLHDHCRLCGSVSDLPADLLDDVAAALSRKYGFRLDATEPVQRVLEPRPARRLRLHQRPGPHPRILGRQARPGCGDCVLAAVPDA